jgi:hypothetical protein
MSRGVGRVEVRVVRNRSVVRRVVKCMVGGDG